MNSNRYYGIALKPPFGLAILHGGKDIENRSKPILGRYRGDLIIYHSKTPDRRYYESALDICHRNGYEPPPFKECPKGALLGIIRVTACKWSHTSQGWGIAHNWHYQLSDPRPFPTPIVWTPKNGLGILQIPNHLITEYAD